MELANVISRIPDKLKSKAQKIHPQVEKFVTTCQPTEGENLQLFADRCTGALFCECHIRASTLVKFGTIDAPLDPEEQADYRANRDLLEDHVAYERMKGDALNGRAFSNLVIEFALTKEGEVRLLVIGGQHRFTAIQNAVSKQVDEFQGTKIYFGLETAQRLDVQLISNTNIAVSTDLLDRMYETVSGPELRSWCQEVGFLDKGQDFADKRQRGHPITVRATRTFIMNYFQGKGIDPEKFDQSVTTPVIANTGADDPDWRCVKEQNPGIWEDKGLKSAAKEFAALTDAQRKAFTDSASGRKTNSDYAEKTFNYAVLSSWAYTAGILERNLTRLERHFALRSRPGKDPLNAAALATGRHKTDPENYRGLGYRTDAKERGRLVELFFLQAEKGDGITKGMIDLAMKKFHAKQALAEVWAAERRT